MTSRDPSRHPGMASSSTGPRTHERAVPEAQDSSESKEAVAAGALWLAFPVGMVLLILLVVVILRIV